MSGDQAGAAVAEVGAEAGTGGGGIADDGGGSGSVADGWDDVVLLQLFDEVEGTGQFGGEGEEPDATAGGVLPALDEIPIGSLDVLTGMRAAGAIVV